MKACGRLLALLPLLAGCDRLFGLTALPPLDEDASSDGITQDATVCSAFAPKVEYQSPGTPLAVALADFTGDGLLDVIALNTTGNTVGIFDNMGAGVLAPGRTYATLVNPAGMAIGMLDSDNQLDVAVTSPSTNSVDILLGANKALAQATPVTAPASCEPWGIVAGPLTSTELDLAIACRLANSVTVLRNDGNAGFSLGLPMSVGSQPWAITAGLFNADTVLDVVVTNSGAASMSYLRGAGSGMFVAATEHATTLSPRAIAASDLNGDARSDVAVANLGGKTISVLRAGDSDFLPGVDLMTSNGPTGVAIADLNLDGSRDIVAVTSTSTDNVLVFFGDGQGGFGNATMLQAGAAPLGVAVGDLDANGYPDIVVANGTGNTISVILGCP